MSFWEDLSKFGTGLLEDVGEGVGNLVDGYTQNVQKDVQANPNTQPHNYPNYADQYGNQITQPQGSVMPVNRESGFMGFTQKELAIGGVGVVVLLALLLRR
ncbi:hypothetical protein KX909_000297 [Vibrio vulnificus]|nr:hypothetical protein [Vibrio vulnificus]